MKKRVLAAFGVALALAAFLVGPDLLDLYRLEQHIIVSAQADEANGGAWPRVSDACVACHGLNGNSLNQHYPSLAGQPAPYLVEQLRNFVTGERVHPIMNAMARSLTEADIATVAEHFSRQAFAENRFFAPDTMLQQEGERLVAAGGCGACHGAGLLGRDPVPRLAGQGYDYLLVQLDGFATGARRDPGNTMNQLASAWTPHDRRAIAAFLAGHPVAIP
jgi:cytochrome c553